MELYRRINGLKRTGLALTVLLGIAMASVSTGQAQDRDRYGRWNSDREKRFAYVLGYHEAYSEGRDVVGYRRSYKDMPSYRDGMNGWLAWMGSRDTYRDHYRKGYADGFRDAQNNRRRRYDRNDVERVLGASLQSVYSDRYRDSDDYARRVDRYDVSRIAEQNGYLDGLRRGQDDRDLGRRMDLVDRDQFHDAISGYRIEYGDREFYREAYRRGYRRGYDEGYRSGRL